MLPKIKKCLVAAIVCFSLVAVSSTAMAAPVQGSNQQTQTASPNPAGVTPAPTLDQTIFSGGYTNKLADGSTPNYYLDVVDDQQNNNNNIFTSTWNFFTGKSLQQVTVAALFEMGNWIANLVFRFNVFMVSVLLSGLQLAFNTTVLDKLIDSSIQTLMRNIAGVTASGSFTTGGLLGSLMPYITSFSALFAIYLLIAKRAQMAAFKSILSTIIVLTLAAGFFANFASFLKGMNTMSTELSEVIIVGPSKIVQNQSMSKIQDELYAQIWDQFVNKPYLYMQYGTDNVKTIGQSRIDTLLKMQPDDNRLQYVTTKEVEAKGNTNMTYSNVNTRVIFSGFYSLFNALNGLPFLLLIIGLVVTEFWFLIIACLAPFVFAWGAFPNQIVVLKRYAYQLALPLAIRILLTLGTFIYTMIVKIVFTLNSSDIGGYIDSTFFIMAILVGFILLRKPIMRIFGGSKEFKMFMNEVKQIKKSTSSHLGTVGKLAGAAIGGYAGGPQGAAIGSQIGGALGGQDGSSVDDVQQTKGAYDSSDKIPKADLPSTDSEPAPLKINDWRDNHAPVDLPKADSVDTSQKSTGAPSANKFELEDLPSYEMEQDDVSSESEIAE